MYITVVVEVGCMERQYDIQHSASSETQTNGKGHTDARTAGSRCEDMVYYLFNFYIFLVPLRGIRMHAVAVAVLQGHVVHKELVSTKATRTRALWKSREDDDHGV